MASGPPKSDDDDDDSGTGQSRRPPFTSFSDARHTDGGDDSSCTVHGSAPVTARVPVRRGTVRRLLCCRRPCSRPPASRLHAAFFSRASHPGPRVPRALLFCFRAPPGADGRGGGAGGTLATRKGRERYGPSIGCRPRDGCQPTWSPRLARTAAAHARPSHRARARVFSV